MVCFIQFSILDETFFVGRTMKELKITAKKSRAI